MASEDRARARRFPFGHEAAEPRAAPLPAHDTAPLPHTDAPRMTMPLAPGVKAAGDVLPFRPPVAPVAEPSGAAAPAPMPVRALAPSRRRKRWPLRLALAAVSLALYGVGLWWIVAPMPARRAPLPAMTAMVPTAEEPTQTEPAESAQAPSTEPTASASPLPIASAAAPASTPSPCAPRRGPRAAPSAARPALPFGDVVDPWGHR